MHCSPGPPVQGPETACGTAPGYQTPQGNPQQQTVGKRQGCGQGLHALFHTYVRTNIQVTRTLPSMHIQTHTSGTNSKCVLISSNPVLCGVSASVEFELK